MKSDEWYHIHQEPVIPPYQFRKKLIALVAALTLLMVSASLTDQMNEPEYLIAATSTVDHTILTE